MEARIKRAWRTEDLVVLQYSTSILRRGHAKLGVLPSCALEETSLFYLDLSAWTPRVFSFITVETVLIVSVTQSVVGGVEHSQHSHALTYTLLTIISFIISKLISIILAQFNHHFLSIKCTHWIH